MADFNQKAKDYYQVAERLVKVSQEEPAERFNATERNFFLRQAELYLKLAELAWIEAYEPGTEEANEW